LDSATDQGPHSDPILETTGAQQGHEQLSTADVRRNKLLMSAAITDLIQKQAIEEIPYQQIRFQSYMFPLKQHGRVRAVLDCSQLNQYIEHKDFKMEGLPTLRYMIRPCDWLIKGDLQDAYLHVPLHPKDQKYAFCWEGKTYQFKALPFGISHATPLFTKIMTRVLQPLRAMGLRLCFYLDDICLMAESREKAIRYEQLLKRHLFNIGFLVSVKKCCWEPQQIQQFLGFVIDTKAIEIRLPKDKILKIRKDMTIVLRRSHLSIRKLAAIAGLLQSTTTAMFPARHHTWQLVSQVHEGLNDPRNPHHSWDWTVTISEASKQCAQWWLTELEGWNGRSMAKEQPDLTLEADASDFGWGYAVHDPITGKPFGQGKWTCQDRSMSINWRELEAVVHALDENAVSWSGKNCPGPVGQRDNLCLDQQTGQSGPCSPAQTSV
jgi:hypothetical protein